MDGNHRASAMFHCAEGNVGYGYLTKDIKTMEDLLINGLQDIYYAEQQIIKSLPKSTRRQSRPL
jgi:hypothetical protein